MSGQSLTELVFDDRFFPGLKDTDVSLRKGNLNILKGPFNFVAQDSGEIMRVRVTEVNKGPFNELPESVFARDGKGGKAETLRDMKIFYPDMMETDAITVISYRPA